MCRRRGLLDADSSYLNSIESYNPKTKQWTSYGIFPENKYNSDAVIVNDIVYVVAGFTGNIIFTNKVFAADLNASVDGVYDMYRKTITKAILDQDILSDLNALIGLDRLSSEAISELNSSGLEDNSVTMAKLEPQLRADLNETISRPFGATLANPYGITGTHITNNSSNYTVPAGKTLIITSSGYYVQVDSVRIRYRDSPPSMIPSGKTVTVDAGNGWSGILTTQSPEFTSITNNSSNYTVPAGKTLIITSSGYYVQVDSVRIRYRDSPPSIIPSGKTVTVDAGNGWSGYLIDSTSF